MRTGVGNVSYPVCAGERGAWQDRSLDRWGKCKMQIRVAGLSRWKRLRCYTADDKGAESFDGSLAKSSRGRNDASDGCTTGICELGRA